MAYFRSIDRVRDLHVDTIIASHEYDPLGSIAEGAMVEEYLKVCEEAAGR